MSSPNQNQVTAPTPTLTTAISRTITNATTIATTATTTTTTIPTATSTPTSSHSSQLPTSQFRAISRNNSNASTASSSNKGDFSSTISTANSATSSRSQLAKHQFIDHRQLLAQCGAGAGSGSNSSPIRSFQRATISSVVKTRAFDKNPILQGLLASTAPSGGQNSVSSSQTPSPHSTPVFSRSRSLRMSEGPHRYQHSPTHYSRASSRTPEIYSFNSGDMSNCLHESQLKLAELSKEKLELNESLEFLEHERQVLIDSAKELKETLQKERSQFKREIEDLKKQLTDSIAARIKAETQLTRNDMTRMSDSQTKQDKIFEESAEKDKQIESLKRCLGMTMKENEELSAMNNEYKHMLTEKLKYNGSMPAHYGNNSQSEQSSDCLSIVTEMARLRLELNEKDKIIEKLSACRRDFIGNNSSTACSEVDTLNKFLDQTVECIKGWPEELAGSKHVQDLMKTLLSTYKPEQDSITLKFENIHL